jgi:hypothetical protein
MMDVAKQQGIGVRMPSWYFSRNTFLMINLAPVGLITLAVLLFVLIVPLTAIGILVFCAALNLAGSFSDIVSSIYVYSHPVTTYLDTNGSFYHEQDILSVRSWKESLRLAMEWFLAKIE